MNQLNNMAVNLDQFYQYLTPINPDPNKGSPNPQVLAIGVIKFLLEMSMYIFILTLVASGMIWLFSLGSEAQVQTAKKSFLYSFIGFLVIVAGYGLLNFVVQNLGFLDITSGQSVPTAGQLTGKIIKLAVTASAVGFMLILLTAGSRYMFSIGGDEEAAAARRQILQAIIGLVLVVGAYSIGRAAIYLVGFAK